MTLKYLLIAATLIAVTACDDTGLSDLESELELAEDELAFAEEEVESAMVVGMADEPVLADWGESLDDSDWERLHPAFAEKLSDPQGYSAHDVLLGSNSFAATSGPLASQCGDSFDVQGVETYNGIHAGLGFSTARINTFEPSTGRLFIDNVTGDDGVCSGTLISSNLFLTASHCVDSSNAALSVQFNFQRAPNGLPRPVSTFAVTSIVEDGAAVGLDFAILRLSGSPGNTFGFRGVRPGDALELAIIQHANGGFKGVDAGTCKELSGEFVEYGNIDTERGSSGSGILDKYGQIVGVHTTGGCDTIFSGFDNNGVRMSFIASASPTITNLYMTPLPGAALDIDAGGGELFVVGTSKRIFRWNQPQAQWDLFSNFLADRISVGPDGLPVVVRSSDGGIFRLDAAGNAHALPGTAHDVGVGGDGRIWIISREPFRGNFRIKRLEPANEEWIDMGGSSVRISVDDDGVPWVVSSANRISRRVGGSWQLMPGHAIDVSAGRNENDVLVVSTATAPGGHTVWLYTPNGNTWTRLLAAANTVATGSGAGVSGDYMIRNDNSIRFLGD